MSLYLEDQWKDTLTETKDLMQELVAFEKLDLFLEDGEEPEKKQGALSKVWNTIKKILTEAMAIIKRTIGGIANRGQYLMMSPSKKKEYDAFCDYVSKNPETKNKQVTVKDYNKISKAYDNVEKKLVQAMQDGGMSADAMAVQTAKDINSLKALGNTAVCAITVEVAMQIARTSPQNAKRISEALRNSESCITTIQNELGTEGYEKVQKNLSKLSKESTFHKLKAMLFKQKEETLTDTVNTIVDEFKKIMSGDATAADYAKMAVNHRSGAATAAKGLMRNKQSREGIKTAVRMKDEVKNTKSELKNAVKYGERLRENIGNYMS